MFNFFVPRLVCRGSRNNHGPGGFVRHAFVTPDQMMDKKAHEAGAFHYSCWGAGTKVATKEESTRDEWQYSITDADGEEHTLPIAYYTSQVVIPDVIPDGDYVMGWTWFGGSFASFLVFSLTPGFIFWSSNHILHFTGTASEVSSNESQGQEPSTYSYFADYWSCR